MNFSGAAESFYITPSHEISDMVKECLPTNHSVTALPMSVKVTLATKMQMIAVMQNFFNGWSTFAAGGIVERWFQHGYGANNCDSGLMYSRTMAYSSIALVHPALSSFTLQLV